MKLRHKRPDTDASRETRGGKWGFWAAITWTMLWLPLRAELTVHAVTDRSGAGTSFVNDSGQLWAWGANGNGQYGDGTREPVVTARKLGFPEGVTQWKLFRTGARFLALDQDGRLFGWGEAEATPTAGHGFPQTKATRLGTNRWVDVVPPEIQLDADTAPFGLGADSTGALRWLRSPAPAFQDIPPFVNFRTDPTSLDALNLSFASVAAGTHGFLALSTDGRVFAAGIPSTGFRGPGASLVGDRFVPEFVEVLAPVAGTKWVRIAAVGETAFGWASNGKLYTWGLENAPGDDTRLSANPVPTLVGVFPGVGSWTEVKGSGRAGGTLVSVDDRGFAHSNGGPLYVSLLGTNGGWVVNSPIIQMPSAWTPIRSISQADTHLLVYGHDGKIHAVGENLDFELGQPGGGSISDGYKPVVPAGLAPFLTGVVAPFSTVSLELLDDQVVEPDAPSTTNLHTGKLRVRSTAGPLNAGLLRYQITTRLTNGLPNPDPSTTNLVRIVSGNYPFGYYNNAGGVMDFDIIPVFNDSQDTPLLVDVTVFPGIDYYLGDQTTATFRYQPTVPLNHPPRVRLIWPPLQSRVYYSDSVDFLLEVSDIDGYVAKAKVELLFSIAGPLDSVDAVLPPSPPGSTNRVRLRLRPLGVGGALFPLISVTDDRGFLTKLPSGNSQGFGASRLSPGTFSVSVQGRVIPLDVPSTLGTLELQASDDLKAWSTVTRYTVPTPGLPVSAVPVEAGTARTRYFRLSNPDAP